MPNIGSLKQLDNQLATAEVKAEVLTQDIQQTRDHWNKLIQKRPVRKALSAMSFAPQGGRG